MTTSVRRFKAEGGEWTVRLEGSSYIGRGGPGGTVRLLNLSFGAPSGTEAPTGTTYVAAGDLSELDEGVLVDLLDALRGPVRAPAKRPGQSHSPTVPRRSSLP